MERRSRATPLEDWRRYREALAGAMHGPDFQTVDGAFHRVANLETWRQAGLEASELVDDARQAAKQLEEVGGILLVKGFSGKELEQMQREMEESHAEGEWPADDQARAGTGSGNSAPLFEQRRQADGEFRAQDAKAKSSKRGRLG